METSCGYKPAKGIDLCKHAQRQLDIIKGILLIRLGWWPARVEQQSKLPDDLKEATTDKTLCVVKFLNEDNYQIIEDRSIICTYNSGQKEEHISAGMSE